jgi:hypothetical protein
MEDKLENLTKLTNSKKILLDNLEKELVKLTELNKKRSSPSVVS